MTLKDPDRLFRGELLETLGEPTETFKDGGMVWQSDETVTYTNTYLAGTSDITSFRNVFSHGNTTANRIKTWRGVCAYIDMNFYRELKAEGPSLSHVRGIIVLRRNYVWALQRNTESIYKGEEHSFCALTGEGAAPRILMKLFKFGFWSLIVCILIHNSIAQDFGILEPSGEVLETGFDNRSLAMGKTTTITLEKRQCQSFQIRPFLRPSLNPRSKRVENSCTGQRRMKQRVKTTPMRRIRPSFRFFRIDRI